MKKIILILVAILLLTGCSLKKVDKPKNYGNDEGLILYFEEGSWSTANPEISETRIYSDKTITYGYRTNDEKYEIGNMKLPDEAYQSIVDIAFSKKFLSLDKDITGFETEGGSSSYITIYYDGKSFRTGGQNIKDKTYQKLVELVHNHQPKYTLDNN